MVVQLAGGQELNLLTIKSRPTVGLLKARNKWVSKEIFLGLKRPQGEDDLSCI